MPEKVLAVKQVVVTRSEANFDRACDEAYRIALGLFRVDEDGYINMLGSLAPRSESSIVVEFKKYEHGGGMFGHAHTYIFEGRVERYYEDDDVDGEAEVSV